MIQQNVFCIGIRLVANGIANGNLVFPYRKMSLKRDILGEKRCLPYRAENLGTIVQNRNVNVFDMAVMQTAVNGFATYAGTYVIRSAGV